MTSAWGSSWGVSWGNSWGAVGAVTTEPAVATPGGGLGKTGGKKRKPKHNPYLDFPFVAEPPVAPKQAEPETVSEPEAVEAKPFVFDAQHAVEERQRIDLLAERLERAEQMLKLEEDDLNLRLLLLLSN